MGKCKEPLGDEVCSTDGDVYCDRLRSRCTDSCSAPGSSTCSWTSFSAPDGTPCAEGKQCYGVGFEDGDDICVDSDSIPFNVGCGNGVIEDGEECDAGAGVDDDCCTAQCTLESTCTAPPTGAPTDYALPCVNKIGTVLNGRDCEGLESFYGEDFCTRFTNSVETLKEECPEKCGT